MRMLSDTPEARKAIEHALMSNNSHNSSLGLLNTSGHLSSSPFGAGGRLRHDSYQFSDDESDRGSEMSYGSSRFERDFEV